VPSTRPGVTSGEKSRAVGRELIADQFVRGGMPRMPARVFAALLTNDSATLNAADLAEQLTASPAAVSGAVRYLEQVNMVRRSREPGSRKDVFSLGDDFWYEAMTNRETLSVLRDVFADAAAAIGPRTPAGARLKETQEFFDFVREEMPAMLARWRRRKAR